MQYALCIDDDRVWEADSFASLSPEEIESKRRNLLCVECREFAWFRKESTHGHPAHFCAHHSEDCELKVDYIIVDDQRADGGVEDGEVASGDTIIVRLDQESGGSVDVSEVQRPPGETQREGGRSHVIKVNGRYSSHLFTLRRILLRLVRSSDFRRSKQNMVFFKNEDDVLIEGPVDRVVKSFSDITKDDHDDGVMFYWGPIASAGRTDDGKLWLNSSDSNKNVSIAIFKDIVDEFLDLFRVQELDELAGAHVLVAGRCIFANTGKPIIWCGTPKYIVVRRYRDERLRAA